ncbi:MAG TPA: L,D-transpeptidase family protein [Thermoanaerobaculia bacterium]|nr:L,D-transpeptidase family protein [Thermoanaerobaculia bacterium]
MRPSLAALLLISAACSMSRDPLAGSRQAIAVVTDDANATSGTLQRYERDAPGGRWREVGAAVRVVVGRRGVAPVGEKREGDGRAPSGVYTLGSAFGFAPSADLRVPYRQLRETTECVDDSASRYYNQIVDRDAVPRVDWSSAEKMRSIALYRWGIVVNYNIPAQPRRGSCIFLHIWSGPSSTTAGCTAMAQDDLETLLHWLDPAANPRVIWSAAAMPPLSSRSTN